MTYPDTIDTFRDVTGYTGGPVLDVNKLKSGDQNNMAASVEGIMNELGTLPKGSYADVKTRLNNLLDVNNIEIWRDSLERTFNGSPELYEVRSISVANASNIFFGCMTFNGRNFYNGVNEVSVRMYFDGDSTYAGRCTYEYQSLNEWQPLTTGFARVNVPTGTRKLYVRQILIIET